VSVLITGRPFSATALFEARGLAVRALDETAIELGDPVELAINLMPRAERAAPIDALEPEDFDRALEHTLFRAWLLLERELRIARSIVFVVSPLALAGGRGFAAESAAEHAIVSLVQSAARTYAGRVQINALAASADRDQAIARAALALFDAGGAITGQTIVLGGALGAF
jgi:NAD(P)-dependent dehydrogenase (short-subunit alcohol dehydrogenase family)